MAVQRDLTLAAYLISRGANANARCVPQYDSPLHCAADAGREAAVRLLLQAGAEPNVLNLNERTPLDAAFDVHRAYERLAVVRALLAAGARWHCRNPIVSIVQGSYWCNELLPDDHKLIELLIAHGADPDLEPTLRRSVPISLLRHGANPNALNVRGNSPLHTALHSVESAYSSEAPALILAGGRLTREEMWSSPHCMRQLAQRFGITEATADWPARVRARLSANELRSLRPLVKLP